MIKSAATCCDAGCFIGVVAKGRCKGRTVDETTQLKRRANESQPWHCNIFSTGRVVSVLWGPGGRQGASGARRRPKARAGRQRVQGKKGRERVVGKVAGDECVFIPWRRTGLADEVRSDAIPDAAGGEGMA